MKHQGGSVGACPCIPLQRLSPQNTPVCPRSLPSHGASSACARRRGRVPSAPTRPSPRTWTRRPGAPAARAAARRRRRGALARAAHRRRGSARALGRLSLFRPRPPRPRRAEELRELLLLPLDLGVELRDRSVVLRDELPQPLLPRAHRRDACGTSATRRAAPPRAPRDRLRRAPRRRRFGRSRPRSSPCAQGPRR